MYSINLTHPQKSINSRSKNGWCEIVRARTIRVIRVIESGQKFRDRPCRELFPSKGLYIYYVITKGGGGFKGPLFFIGSTGI